MLAVDAAEHVRVGSKRRTSLQDRRQPAVRVERNTAILLVLGRRAWDADLARVPVDALVLNKRINWDTCQIGIPGATAKDKENRRIPFNPNGRLAAVLQRRATLGPDAYVFGSVNGEHQPTIQTAWETLKLLANGVTPKAGKEGSDWNAEQLRRIDLRWHDLRHEGACRLLADGVDIRIIQLMLGHASIQQTQRYLNVTDEELRRGLEVSWKNESRPLRVVSRS